MKLIFKFCAISLTLLADMTCAPLVAAEETAPESSFDVIWTNYPENSRLSEIFTVKFLLRGEGITVNEGAQLSSIGEKNSEYQGLAITKKSLDLYTEPCDREGTMIRADYTPNYYVYSLPLTNGNDLVLTIPAGSLTDREGKTNEDIVLRLVCGARDKFYTQEQSCEIEVCLPGEKSFKIQAFPKVSNDMVITPPENWKVTKVIHDGEDKTLNFISGHYIFTPAQDGKIEVGYTYKGTIMTADSHTSGIAELTNGAVKVWPEGGCAVISGAETGTKISVYTLEGHRVATAVAAEGETRIPVEAGTYLVIIGNEAAKIMIR